MPEQMHAVSRRRNGQWRDIFGSFNSASGVAALVFEQYRATVLSMYFLRHDQDDAIYQRYQFQHDFLGNTINLHVHVVPMSTWVPGAATKDVYWEVTYVWAPIGSVVPDSASWSTTNATQPLAPSDQYLHKVFTIASITPPASVIATPASCELLCRVRRLGTNLADTYNDNKAGPTGQANLALLDIDAHYQTYKHGTASEYGP